MILERSNDRLDHVAMRSGAALHVDMRLFVGSAPFVGEPLERLLGVAVPQLHPRVASRRPLSQDVHRRIEPHGDRTAVEQFARTLIDISSAASRNDSDVAFDESRDQASLAVAEIMLAVALKNLCRREARCVFDGCVAVDERQAQALRKAPADSRFSNSHQAHQHDRPVEALPQIDHRKGLYSGSPARQKRLMSRLVVLIIVLVIIVGGLFYLSTVPKEQPTHTIEVPVAQGNAH